MLDMVECMNNVTQVRSESKTAINLLIVENQNAELELIIKTLLNADIIFTYDLADTYTNCQQLLQKTRYDAVLSTYCWSEFSSIQLLNLLKEFHQNIPLILISERIGEEATVECIKAGITDYVLKDRLFRLPTVLQRSLAEFERRCEQQEQQAKLEQQAERERLLNQISHSLNSSLDPEYILTEIVKRIGECFRVDRVAIFAIHETEIQVINEWKYHDQIDSLLDFKTPKDPCYRMIHNESESIRQGCLYLTINQPEQEQHQQKNQAIYFLSVPIFIRDRLFGCLTLHTLKEKRIFPPEEIALLRGIADQAAIALYNAQNYERLEELVRQRTQELEKEKIFSESANRSKSEFLGNMSHELRTPLTGILGFSHVLLQEVFGSLNEKQKQYIAGINSCGKHLLDLINDLLDLSKLEAGKESLNLETIVIAEICEASIFLIRERVADRGLEISTVITTNLTTFIADQRRVKQILFNLLSNAVKFTPTGSVTLKVEQIQDIIQFSVIDTGIGIAESDKVKLFQPFQQLDSSLSRKYEGSGLGLALSRNLARLHGGDITFTSELGLGSCFTLSLPIIPIIDE